MTDYYTVNGFKVYLVSKEEYWRLQRTAVVGLRFAEWPALLSMKIHSCRTYDWRACWLKNSKVNIVLIQTSCGQCWTRMRLLERPCAFERQTDAIGDAECSDTVIHPSLRCSNILNSLPLENVIHHFCSNRPYVSLNACLCERCNQPLTLASNCRMPFENLHQFLRNIFKDMSLHFQSLSSLMFVIIFAYESWPRLLTP
jgi:hypothetical protein